MHPTGKVQRSWRFEDCTRLLKTRVFQIPVSRYLGETSVLKHTSCKRYLRIKGFWDEESAHRYLHSDTLDINYVSKKEMFYNKVVWANGIWSCDNRWKRTCKASENSDSIKISDTMHSSVGTTGQNIVQWIKCTDRNVWTKTVASEEEDKPATVLYSDINSLNLI